MTPPTGEIITRFPPSPTGPLHIGNVRTAIFNYFFAKKHGGKFVVRIEDTDRARSRKEYEEDMLKNIEWLGLARDGELWHQSERGAVYQNYIEKLIAEDKAYLSQETEGENKEVIRFRNPKRTVVFEDLVRGTVTFDTTELGDFIIARNKNEPLYHLTVVIDDFETGVTHVIRGEDHVSNTPRQILIQEAVGAPRPVYAHLPLILAPDRSKLSKRKHGESVSLDYYRTRGYLPEALVNYIALLGWNPGTEQEIFTKEELVAAFDISRIQKGGAIFDEEKLNWVNKEHMKRIPETDAKKQIEEECQHSAYVSGKGWKIDPEILNQIWRLLFERISRWSEVEEILISGEFDFAFTSPVYEKELLLWKDEKDFSAVLRHIEHSRTLLGNISDQEWSQETVKEALWDYASETGRGFVLWPVRVALSGKEKSPDPFVLAGILGKTETLSRLQKAEETLSDTIA